VAHAVPAGGSVPFKARYVSTALSIAAKFASQAASVACEAALAASFGMVVVVVVAPVACGGTCVGGVDVPRLKESVMATRTPRVATTLRMATSEEPRSLAFGSRSLGPNCSHVAAMCHIRLDGSLRRMAETYHLSGFSTRSYSWR
jgi:hypothetical protein